MRWNYRCFRKVGLDQTLAGDAIEASFILLDLLVRDTDFRGELFLTFANFETRGFETLSENCINMTDRT